jgi:hypothetical protein
VGIEEILDDGIGALEQALKDLNLIISGSPSESTEG